MAITPRRDSPVLQLHGTSYTQFTHKELTYADWLANRLIIVVGIPRVIVPLPSPVARLLEIPGVSNNNGTQLLLLAVEATVG